MEEYAEDIERFMNIEDHLIMCFHVDTCIREKKANEIAVGYNRRPPWRPCTRPKCDIYRRLLTHVLECRVGCDTQGCRFTLLLLYHYNVCESRDCQYCGKFLRLMEDEGEMTRPEFPMDEFGVEDRRNMPEALKRSFLGPYHWDGVLPNPIHMWVPPVFRHLFPIPPNVGPEYMAEARPLPPDAEIPPRAFQQANPLPPPIIGGIGFNQPRINVGGVNQIRHVNNQQDLGAYLDRIFVENLMQQPYNPPIIFEAFQVPQAAQPNNNFRIPPENYRAEEGYNVENDENYRFLLGHFVPSEPIISLRSGTELMHPDLRFQAVTVLREQVINHQQPIYFALDYCLAYERYLYEECTSIDEYLRAITRFVHSSRRGGRIEQDPDWRRPN